jgi:hypothetical protein
MMRARLSGAKYSWPGTVPANVPKNRSLSSGLSRNAASSCCHGGSRRAKSIVLWKPRAESSLRRRSYPASARPSGARAGEPGVDRGGEQLRVAEGVADAEVEDRVLVVTGVADERPAGSIRAAVEVRQHAGLAEAVSALGRAGARSESGGGLERLQNHGTYFIRRPRRRVSRRRRTPLCER